MDKKLLRNLQLVELEILRAVKKVCEDYGIHYYLSGGTLLGAVRHEGFIPWDDDIDISMEYSEYLRFCDVAQEALGNQFFVQNTNTDSEFSFAYTKVRKNNTKLMSPWEAGTPGHHGVWIDIIPLININPKEFKLKKNLLTATNVSLLNNEAFKKGKTWLEEQSSKRVVNLVSAVRIVPFPIRKKVCQLIRKQIFKRTESTHVSEVWGSITSVLPKTVYFGEPKMLVFEGELFPAPHGYHEYLTLTYGNYMTPPPESERNGGHGEIIVDLESAL